MRCRRSSSVSRCACSSITVDINRPNFMFNPTNCDAQQITATVSGADEALANVATPFAAASCKSLAFKPVVHGQTPAGIRSRLGGASLDAKLSYPAGSGSVARRTSRGVKVELPKQLPSRLSTLQKACSCQRVRRRTPRGAPQRRSWVLCGRARRCYRSGSQGRCTSSPTAGKHSRRLSSSCKATVSGST